MSLDAFLDDSTLTQDKKYQRFIELKNKLVKEGLPENVATYKASCVLTPHKLEKIRIATENKEYLKDGITFFVENPDDLKLIGKYFPYNPHVGQVRDSWLLIELLKLMETL